MKKFLASAIPFRIVKRDAFNQLDREKLALIDFACERLRIKSFADLGGVWNVDGGYTFYALQKCLKEKAVLVDTDFTEAVLKKKDSYPRLRLVEGNFGDEETAQQVGDVDAVILFDTLLHQVKPDWDQILEMYAGQTRNFLILNQQFTAAPKTVRLLDLGQEEYFKNVPHSKDDEPYRTVFQKMYEPHPQHQRIYRDIHNIWQWGIVDDDLIEKVRSLGFKLQFDKNAGQFGKLANFENHSFIFSR